MYPSCPVVWYPTPAVFYPSFHFLGLVSYYFTSSRFQGCCLTLSGAKGLLNATVHLVSIARCCCIQDTLAEFQPVVISTASGNHLNVVSSISQGLGALLIWQEFILCVFFLARVTGVITLELTLNQSLLLEIFLSNRASAVVWIAS